MLCAVIARLARGAARLRPVTSSNSVRLASRTAKLCSAGGGRALGLDHVIEPGIDVVGLVAFGAQPDAAILHVHQRKLHAHQGDALDGELALQEGRGGQIDIGLGRLGHDFAVLVQDARAQHHQIDPALLPAPFDRGLVILQGDAGQGALDGAGQGSAARAPARPAPPEAGCRRRRQKTPIAATSAPTQGAAWLM